MDGSLYNTETAKKLASYENQPTQDSNYYCETLYQTKSGKYFLHGQGGGSTIYGSMTSVDSAYRYRNEPGEAIRPLSHREAAKWAEEFLGVEQYMELFEPVDEDDEGGARVPLNLSVSPACKNKLNRLREQKRQSMSVIVENLVMECKEEGGAS